MSTGNPEAGLTETPRKKRKTLFATQTNTIDKYFWSPSRNSTANTKNESVHNEDDEVICVCEKIENNSRATRKVNSKNNTNFSKKVNSKHLQLTMNASEVTKKRKISENIDTELVSSKPVCKNMRLNRIDAVCLNNNQFENMHLEVTEGQSVSGNNNYNSIKETTQEEDKNGGVPGANEPSKDLNDINYGAGTIEYNNINSSPNLQTVKKEIINISAQLFKDIVYSCYHEDFYNAYRKLNNELIPNCCDPIYCSDMHKVVPQEISSFQNGPFFNILDNTLANWVYDLSTAAFSVLQPGQYFRSDVLRILFDYVLNGPVEHLMWDVNHIVSTHFKLHPPCSEPIRRFYLQLLDQPYSDESYFKTKLSEFGVLNYVINQLEDYYKPNESTPATEINDDMSFSVESAETSFVNQKIHRVTFETMEERWNNFQPLLDDEYNQVMGDIDDMAENCSQKNKPLVLKKSETLPRLTIALELIVDLLVDDLLICISKLKRYIMEDESIYEEPVPLVKQFECELYTRVFKLYAKTQDIALWNQLARLIGVCAEAVHLFKPKRACPPVHINRVWLYPDLHAGCESFASTLSKTIADCEWSEDERLQRLEMLRPPWLQLKVALEWANSQLKVNVGSDLKALVEIIHMHVKSPVKLEMDTKKFKPNPSLMRNQPATLAKKAVKRNQYGETLLHRLCKQKGSSVSELCSVLALPQVDVNARDNYGWTPLHEAVNASSILKTKALLHYEHPEGGKVVDIGAQSNDGTTALHEAVSAANLKMCQLLVDHGGVCLLRKTDGRGETPLTSSNKFPEVKEYFEKVMRAQELLNLTPHSLLNLPDPLIRLLMVACDAFIEDHHTWRIYRIMRRNNCTQTEPKKWFVLDHEILRKFKEDQDQFRKLRRILNKLAENPKNSFLVRAWDSKFLIMPEAPTESSENQFTSSQDSCRLLVKELCQLKYESKNSLESPNKGRMGGRVLFQK